MLELPQLDATNLLQVLILAGGVYLLLTFLETTRGSGMVRGLGFALLVGGPAIWFLTVLLNLQQLQIVLRAIAQVAVIVLVILFHPELRRGIMRLGDNALLRRLFKSDHSAAVEEVVAAIVSMARDRVGALVAFERRVPLDAYIERGVRVNAEVNRLLLESLFHEGNKLHDGAVILRGDRVEAAACILPLSENQELSKSTGTRHRAALGLTEETDAVAVVVSEETGLISVCKEGAMERRVARDAVEEVLRELLAPRGGSEASERLSIGAQVRRLFTHRPLQKAISLGLGVLLFLGAWRAERTKLDEVLTVYFVEENSAPSLGPEQSYLTVIQPPGVRAKLVDAGGKELVDSEGKVRIQLNAQRNDLQKYESGIKGRLTLASGETGLRELRVGDITWVPGGPINKGDASVSWSGSAPILELVAYETRELVPDSTMLRVGDEQLDEGWELDRPNIRFVPSTVVLKGPADHPLEPNASAPLFEDVELPARTWSQWQSSPVWSEELTLNQDLATQGFELVSPAAVVVPILPQVLEVGEVEVDVAVVSLDTTAPDLATRYTPPRETVRIVISAEGILTGRDEDDRLVRLALTGLVREEGQAWIDVGGREVAVQTFDVQIRDIPREVWLASLPAEVQERLSSARNQRLILRAEPEVLELRPADQPVEAGPDDEQNGEDS